VGIGDEIMAAGQARATREQTGRAPAIIGRNGRARWSDIWQGNPNISQIRNGKTPTILNGPGARPYIDGKTPKFWVWKKWDRVKGDIYLSDAECEFAAAYRDCVMIEPNTKVQDGNKSWPWDRWQDFVLRADSAIRFIQVGPQGTRKLDRVEHVRTTFRQGCAILAGARCFIGTEGALHHAAAALGVPAVVLWGEFISPEYTGYLEQLNLRHADRACGSRIPCATCRKSMEAISTDEVLENFERAT